MAAVFSRLGPGPRSVRLDAVPLFGVEMIGAYLLTVDRIWDLQLNRKLYPEKIDIYLKYNFRVLVYWRARHSWYRVWLIRQVQ